MMEFMKTIKEIKNSLLIVSADVARYFNHTELIRMSFNYENNQEALQTRMLLVILSKLNDWNFSTDITHEITNIGNWNEIAPKMKDVIEDLEAIIQDPKPTITFKNLEILEKDFMNEFLIRNQNITNNKLIVLKILIQQLILLNVIKQKTLVSERLIDYFEDFMKDYKNKKTANPVQIKRILHILISKNFMNDDCTQNSNFMFNFNQTFSEIIEIITSVRNLEFTNKMMAQVAIDYPAVFDKNPSFKTFYESFEPEELLKQKDELVLNQKLEISDFNFNISNRVYNLFIDRHAKHKIFFESVEEFNVKRLLKTIQEILVKIDRINPK